MRRHAHQSNNRPRYRGEPVSEYSSIGIERGGIRRFRKESTTYCRVDSYYARKGGQREEFRRILTRIIICDSCNRATMEARATFYRSRFGKKRRKEKKNEEKKNTCCSSRKGSSFEKCHGDSSKVTCARITAAVRGARVLNRNCARHGSGGGVTWARPSGTKGHERQETVVLCAGCRNFRVLWPFVFPFTRRASERASERASNRGDTRRKGEGI